MTDKPAVPSMAAADNIQPLLEQLEEAWNASRDSRLVDRLAAGHPAHAEELYEFFADLVEAELQLDRPRPEFAVADERARRWLESGGFQAAAAAKAAAASSSRATDAGSPTSTTVRPLLRLLKDETGEDVGTLATALGLTSDFLVEVSEHADVLPMAARVELARRIEHARGINRARSLEALTVPGRQFQRAASRDRPYSGHAPTFQELVQRSSLDAERKQEWLLRV